jgi:hypothetical protein
MGTWFNKDTQKSDQRPKVRASLQPTEPQQVGNTTNWCPGTRLVRQREPGREVEVQFSSSCLLLGSLILDNPVSGCRAVGQPQKSLSDEKRFPVCQARLLLARGLGGTEPDQQVAGSAGWQPGRPRD